MATRENYLDIDFSILVESYRRLLDNYYELSDMFIELAEFAAGGYREDNEYLALIGKCHNERTLKWHRYNILGNWERMAGENTKNEEPE